MTDSLRSERPAAAGDVPERERDARVEELLLSGLDHYFAAQYDLAISVWTRVLFLNHGHARARAYIERARRAISERQREAEELLHTGVEAFRRGDSGQARRLLTSAVDRGVSSDEALALLDRLARLEAAAGPRELRTALPPHLDAPRVGPASAGNPSSSSRTRWVAAGIVAGLGVAGAAMWLWVKGADWVLLDSSAPRTVVPPIADEALPVPQPSETSLARARVLYARGHLHEALSALEPIRYGDVLAAEADQLRATIQRDLLAAAGRVPPIDGAQRAQVRPR
jgi:hypothetical protein